MDHMDHELAHELANSLAQPAFGLTNLKRHSRPWICQHIESRHASGEFRTLFYELDDEHFQLYYRVTRVQFYDLLSLIIGDITKQNTNYRMAITPEERLAICLRQSRIVHVG
ncbi:hypothetical protein OBRU01_18655 [Operophtera brumata]|uniref:Uncharacterized protein n=1 Tax=Operophtera brumata TaxID=104452 RepID=A0A0L7KY39_OPEBR|nr:hypothetical protein OBRU01_18655 [Operophtera brumata]